MLVSLIVAVAENGTIGRKGGLPWKLSNDLRHFKTITMCKPVVMGRKTFDSIGRPLAGRLNFVVTRNSEFYAEGITTFPSLPVALEHVRGLGAPEVIILGGAALYREVLPSADRMYLTEVHAEVAGDVTFPFVERSDWVEVSREWNPTSVRDEHDHSFVTFDRVKTA
ncbi:MAG: dihydrofolate reductase [Pseudomonadota bacterium]|nr:dihydrofolate reductase [Pseudomonadota bacterium]